MMKNKTPLFIVLGVVLLGVVVFVMMQGRNGSNPIASLTSNTSNPSDMVASALTGSGSIKCEYTDEDGATVIAYVKNGNVRSDYMGADANGSFLMKDKTVWTWDEETKTGMTYVIPDVTPGAEDDSMMESEDSDTNYEEMKEEIDQYKESCKNENIPDSMFEVPQDVTFEDYSAMMEGMYDGASMEDAMNQIPEEYQQYLNQ